MQTSRTLQIELPPPFPTNILDHVVDGVVAVGSETAGAECTDALVAVAYRYRAMHQAQRTLSGSLAVNRRGGTADERFIQDTELAHFLFDGMSCLEALCYAAYLCGHMAKPNRFPIHGGALVKVTPASIEKSFRKHLPGTALGAALRDVIEARQFSRWRTTRSLVGRRSKAGKSPPPGLSRPGLEERLDLDAITESRVWLDDQVSVLLRNILGFLGSELKVLHAAPTPSIVR